MLVSQSNKSLIKPATIEAEINNIVSGNKISSDLFMCNNKNIGCNNLFENNMPGEDKAPKNGIIAPMLIISVKDEIIIKINNKIKCFCLLELI